MRYSIIITALLCTTLLFSEEKPESKYSFTVEDVRKCHDYSPDLRLLAVAGEKGPIEIRTREGKHVRTLPGHTTPVWSLRFSPGGRLLASGAESGEIKIWNMQGKALRTFKDGANREVLCLAVSPDDRLIAAGMPNGTVNLWSADGTLVRTLRGRPIDEAVHAVSFSPDGTMILLAVPMEDTVLLWSVGGKLLRTFRGGCGQVWQALFSPDGKYIATGSEFGMVKIWSIGGKCVRTFEGHNGAIQDIAFSKDGRLIASTSEDKSTFIWSIEGTIIRKIPAYGESVRFLSESRLLIQSGWISPNDNRSNVTLEVWKY